MNEALTCMQMQLLNFAIITKTKNLLYNSKWIPVGPRLRTVKSRNTFTETNETAASVDVTSYQSLFLTGSENFWY